ncbi:MAG TPA: hypothetical protein VJ776_06985 [Thermoanaerobaculia bacterium]|nr:hypothetical protein [Thermoanaerobaculia bacterium]
MGNDLLSACVFCAGMLLGLELPPPPGYHVEASFSYATSARRYETPDGRNDVSDVTPKFALVGFGGSRPPGEGMGGGTPEAEWRVRVGLGTSHDEQEQTPFAISNTNATGTGRFENFAIVLRHPFSPRDSVEAGWNRRHHSSTDLVDIGQERYVLSEERVLSAERIDVGLGWRHRWKGFEAALSARYVRPDSSNAAAGAFQITEGHLWGGALDARARLGRWTLSAGAERSTGTLSVHEESQPAFVGHDFGSTATLEAYRLGVGYAVGKRDFFLQATYDRSRLPFVSFAVLGSEVAAFESGYHPESRSRVLLWDLTARHEFAPGFRFKLMLRNSRGSETLGLTDPAGVLPAKELDIRRSGVFGSGLSRALGAPEVTLGFGAELSLPWRSP